MMEEIVHVDSWFFEKIMSGEKNFEIRLGSMEIKEGDVLIIKERGYNGEETGRELKKKVGFTLRTNDLTWWNSEEKNKHGFVVMQLGESE
jgi:hypothetical protein